MVGQLPDLFGVKKGSGDFFEKLGNVIRQLGDTHVLTLVIGLASLATVLGSRRVAPRVPGSLVAVLFGIVLVAVFSLNDHGVAIVGHISSGLPSIGVPNAPRSDYVKLLSSGIGIMLVGFAERLGAAKTYAAREGYQIDPDRGLIGVGAANVAAGLLSGMVVNGSPDFIAAVGALLGVTIFDTLPGLFIGIASSLLLLIYRASRPRIARLVSSPAPAATTATWSVTPRTTRASTRGSPRAYSTVQAAVDAAQRSAS